MVKSNVNYVVADTSKWEQQAATSSTRTVRRGVRENAGLGSPSRHPQRPGGTTTSRIHRRQGTSAHPISSSNQGFDDLAEVKTAAAQRWVAHSECRWPDGTWHYSIARESTSCGHRRFSEEIAPAPTRPFDLRQVRVVPSRVGDDKLRVAMRRAEGEPINRSQEIGSCSVFEKNSRGLSDLVLKQSASVRAGSRR